MTLTAIRPLAGRGKGRETVDPFPGRFLQATGSYREGETDRRVAVAIGPQYGTVGPDLVREARRLSRIVSTKRPESSIGAGALTRSSGPSATTR